MKNEKIKNMNMIEELENLIVSLEHSEKNSNLIEYDLGDLKDCKDKNRIIELLKLNVDILRKKKNELEINDDYEKEYLLEIISKEKPVFGSNNLIYSPVGSGKTTFIEHLIDKYEENSLFLVSNTTLKNSICPDNKEQLVSRFFTSKSKKKSDNQNIHKVHVMSYSEFGNRIRYNNDFVKDIKYIYCDEIHSLPDYQSYDDSAALSQAIKFLFEAHEDKTIFYFTATDENIKKLKKKESTILRNVKVFDYRNHPNIKQYVALSEYKINHIEQIRPHLKARLKSFNYFGYKCYAFNKTIKGMKMIEKMAREEGFNPISIWSINQEEESLKLSEEQLRVRDDLLTKGILSEPYNCLIINSAMQEGWNLRDKKIKLAIMNTTNETEKTQAIGRYRSDLDILIYRTTSSIDFFEEINLQEKWLNTPLTNEDKNNLINELNLIDKFGRQRKWQTIKKMLIDLGYVIEDKQRVINGVKRKVSLIMKF